MCEVEVNQKRKSNLALSKLQQLLGTWLMKKEYVTNGVQLQVEDGERELKDHVEYVMVCGDGTLTHLPSVNIIYW